MNMYPEEDCEEPICPVCDEVMEWVFEGEIDEETGRARATHGQFVCTNPDCKV